MNLQHNEQTEGVIRNIIVEISRECMSRGHSVSETLVAFIVKAIALDPKNEFYLDRFLTKSDVKRLISLCVKKLMTVGVASLDTIKMQIDFDMNYTDRDSFLSEHERVLTARLVPIMNEICDCRARNKEELENLYRRIVSVCILKSGMGSATEIEVIRESTAALQSVFPQTELANFMMQNRQNKEHQLNELSSLVTGIRIFNKDCAKGGKNFDDLVGILNEAIPAATQNLDKALKEDVSTIEESRKLVSIFNKEVSTEKFPITQQTVKMIMVNLHQHEIYVKILLNQVILCAQHTQSYQQKLQTTLAELHELVQNKAAIATRTVYPKFYVLANIWTDIQNEMIILSLVTNIFNSLEEYIKNQKNLINNSKIKLYIESKYTYQSEEKVAEDISIQKSPFLNYQWINIKKIRNYSNNMLQFRCYCLTHLVNTEGMLKEANPDIGVLNYKDKYYAFSGVEEAREFCENPEYYLSRVMQLAKSNCELIQFLQLHRLFDSFSIFGANEIEKQRQPIATCDEGTQTDTHFHKSIIIRNYDWNEWELRRKAIKLVNLRKKLTHSVQTDQSHSKRDNWTQVYLPKEKEVQTMGVDCTNVPKIQTFYYGLRGCPTGTATKIEKVDLTLDVQD